MANEIAVEQQRKPSALPTLLTAGVAGGAAAYLTRPKYQTHEEIINSIKDVTDFSEKSEPEVWNAVKEKYNKVQELEKELEAKIKESKPKTSKGQKLTDEAKKVAKEAGKAAKKLEEETIPKAKEELTQMTKELSQKLGKSGNLKKRIIAICLSVLGGGILGKILFGRKKNA